MIHPVCVLGEQGCTFCATLYMFWGLRCAFSLDHRAVEWGTGPLFWTTPHQTTLGSSDRWCLWLRSSTFLYHSVLCADKNYAPPCLYHPVHGTELQSIRQLVLERTPVTKVTIFCPTLYAIHLFPDHRVCLATVPRCFLGHPVTDNFVLQRKCSRSYIFSPATPCTYFRGLGRTYNTTSYMFGLKVTMAAKGKK